MNEYQVLAYYKHNTAAMQMNILDYWCYGSDDLFQILRQN